MLTVLFVLHREVHRAPAVVATATVTAPTTTPRTSSPRPTSPHTRPVLSERVLPPSEDPWH